MGSIRGSYLPLSPSSSQQLSPSTDLPHPAAHSPPAYLDSSLFHMVHLETVQMWLGITAAQLPWERRREEREMREPCCPPLWLGGRPSQLLSL